MPDSQSDIERLYARARERRLRMMIDELRERLRPFSEGLDPELFEEEIAEMAEHRLAEQEHGVQLGRLSRMTPI